MSAHHTVRAGLRSFSNVVTDRTPDGGDRGLAVIDADPAEIAARRRNAPADVIIEPEVLRVPARFALSSAAMVRPATLGTGATFAITVRSKRGAAPNASVQATFSPLRTGSAANFEVFTDAQGRASVNYDPRQWQVANVIVTPQAGLWSWWAASPASGGVLTLPDLPLNAQLGWWHQLLGITAYRENAGQGIRIGLADTGAGPHQNLPHLQSAGAFIDGGHDASAAASNDVSDHGTHVAGIVAAHPAGNGYAGIAPGADVVAARVYRDAGAAASNADVAAALDAFATEHRCDLINLSLGGSQSSAIELDAVTAAAEKGSLVLAAAGNTAGAIDYPAAYPGVVAVSAVGLYGTFPMNAIEALALPASADKFVGSLFEASFNNSGPHMACTAPGVGIISTVPGDGYASMSGTSMACPVVTAALATLLAADANYVRLPRDVSRARYAWNVLLRSLRSLGLNSTYQGLGLVTGSAT